MRISVIGAGYVGLITGLCLAEKGYQVICVDLDQEKVERINHKIPPIHEKGLEELLRKNINRNLKLGQIFINLYWNRMFHSLQLGRLLIVVKLICAT